MRRILTLLGAVLVLALGPVESGSAAVSCHAIDATGAGQDLGGGATVARISGGGLLHGRTVGSFSVVDVTNAPALGIAGTVTFTTNKGTLTVAVSGVFNVATGVFEASGPVAGATGKLEGATGAGVGPAAPGRAASRHVSRRLASRPRSLRR